MLYSTKAQAKEILEAGEFLGLTTKDYMWIVTRSIVGVDPKQFRAPNQFPPGMLGEYILN